MYRKGFGLLDALAICVIVLCFLSLVALKASLKNKPKIQPKPKPIIIEKVVEKRVIVFIPKKIEPKNIQPKPTIITRPGSLTQYDQNGTIIGDENEQ
jgi:hypothetical protein